MRLWVHRATMTVGTFLQEEVAVLNEERISQGPDVWMFTAPNPGPKTLDGTHTFVVGRSIAYVIDPGPAHPVYQDQLAEWLRTAGARVVAILLSHGHPDHTPGAARLAASLAVPVWSSEKLATEENIALPVDRAYGSNQRFPTDDDALQVVPSPGHSEDHVAFWLEGARILFAGDAILGRGTTLIAPPQGNMIHYVETLRRLQNLDALLIAPGHGPLITNPAGKIAEYLRHREQREAQVIEALREGPATVQELVERLYHDVDNRLHGLAAGSVQAQLEKLEIEGYIQRIGERFTAVDQ